jgi:hypothetical protein
MLCNDRPETLVTWRISAKDPETIACVATLFRGTPEKTDDADQYGWHVVTEASTIDAILPGPHALRVRWQRDGRGDRCDGLKQGAQADCSCVPLPTLADRKAAARQGHGCVPYVELSFQLLRDPALGIFTFVSGNWLFAEQAMQTKATLDALNGRARLQLHLKQSDHTLHGGRSVTYTRPTLTLLGTACP